jgi:hypothetical protein
VKLAEDGADDGESGEDGGWDQPVGANSDIEGT